MGELLSNKDSLIVYLAAQGKTAPEIADAISIPVSTVRSILQREHVQFEIGHLRHKLFGKDIQKAFKELVPDAQGVISDIIRNPNTGIRPQLKLEAAKEVLDRALGKPKQSIEHSGSLIRDVYDRLREEQAKPALDVTPVANEAEPEQTGEPENPVDAWAKKNL